MSIESVAWKEEEEEERGAGPCSCSQGRFSHRFILPSWMHKTNTNHTYTCTQGARAVTAAPSERS